MATTKDKLNKLSRDDFDSKSTNLMFPMDLLSSDGQNGSCMTLFFNTIKNSKARLTFNGGLTKAKNTLHSAYGEVPVIHNTSSGLQGRNNSVFNDSFTRSDLSITLPMPKNLNINIQSRWATTELGAAAFGIDQGTDLASTLENGGGGELAKQLGLNTVGSIASKFAGGAIKGKEIVELGTSTVANNYAETMFKNVDNRSFSWSWTLTPRNEKEAEAIDNILRVLRFHMLPEFKKNVGNGNAFLLYPSSVDVVFWQDGKPNRYIPRVNTCAITGLDTNYTPNGSFITTVAGSPQSYVLSLNFTELAILHKDLVGTEDAAGTGTTF